MAKAKKPLIKTPKKLLLDSEYFPKELPACFSTDELNSTKFISDILYSKEKSDIEIRSGSHSHPRDSQRRRPLSLPNPIGYAKLVEEISAGYKEIHSYCQGARLSKSKIPNTGIALRRISPNLGDVRFSEWQRPILSENKFILSLDLTRFYGSIYTHSIPWALHSKSVAKKHTQDKSLLGNRLDIASRRMQSNQTIGIPIGPSTSFIISEIISTAIEGEISPIIEDHGISGYRYLDDWFLAANDRASLERVYAGVRKAAQDFELSVNEDKTYIVENKDWRQDKWRHTLSEVTEQASSSHRTSKLEYFFDTMYDLREKYPSAHVSRYALGSLLHQDIHLLKPDVALDHVARSLIAAPEAADIAVQCLRDCIDQASAAKKKKVNDQILARLSDAVVSIHDGEASYLLWYCKTVGLTVPDNLIKQIMERMGPASKIIALDIFVSKKGVGQLSKLGLGPVSDEDLRGPEWLFHYERYANGWSQGVGLTKVSDPFMALKDEDFHFYRPEIEMPLNTPEDSFDDDWSGSTSSSFYD